MEKLLNRIWYTLLVIIALMILEPGNANASAKVKLTPEECHLVAQRTKTVHMAYKTGIKKETVLILYSGSGDYNRRMRDVVHKIYRSDSKEMDSDALYLVVYDICLTQ